MILIYDKAVSKNMIKITNTFTHEYKNMRIKNRASLV